MRLHRSDRAYGSRARWLSAGLRYASTGSSASGVKRHRPWSRPDAGQPSVEASWREYRPRDPRRTPLYRLFVEHFETLLSVWDDRFQQRYGLLLDTRVHLGPGDREGVQDIAKYLAHGPVALSRLSYRSRLPVPTWCFRLSRRRSPGG